MIEGLKKKDWYNGQIEHIEEIPEKGPKYSRANLSSTIKNYLEEEKIRLYTHQAKTINSIKNGQDVIITTPTASGKTLAFNIPVMEKLIEDKKARALYIYPTKALSNDQFNTLKELDGKIGAKTTPAIYDGDTPKHLRPKIRKHSRIVVTNPYGIHQYLPWHDKWKGFFENLQYIVIDEAHNYRGVFGSNVAMLIRRLLRVCRHYGSNPQFILSSATIANPRELSRNLTGKEFEIISEDGSESGEKHFVLWNSLNYPDNSPHVQTSNLLSFAVDNDFQTLCFTISRKMAELISMWSSKQSTGEIRAYRAGYLPEDRRKIERSLKNGQIDGVASTNALELGVDVGGLDVVLISGYPGTIISTWQQAGRAGRGRGESSAFLIAFENPLDQYFMKHPEKFFGRSHEHAIIDLDNSYITMGHLMCATSELPVSEGDWFYENYEEEISSLEKKNLIKKTPMGHIYSGTGRPSQTVKLNNIRSDIIKVVEDGEILETMDLSQAYREAHEGAVFLHKGETYIVQSLNLEDKVAKIKKEAVDYHTESLSSINIRVVEKQTQKEKDDVKFCFGDVDVSENYWGYRLKKFDEVVGVKSLDLPVLNFRTEGVWIEIPKKFIEDIKEKKLDPEGGLHAIEHATIAMAPFHAMCDRWDVGGVSAIDHPDTEGATVFVYDAYEGGIGVSKKSYELIYNVLKVTYELIRDCECDEGCPSCIYSPKCGNNNEPLDKQAAVEILSKLLTRFTK